MAVERLLFAELYVHNRFSALTNAQCPLSVTAEPRWAVAPGYPVSSRADQGVISGTTVTAPARVCDRPPPEENGAPPSSSPAGV